MFSAVVNTAEINESDNLLTAVGLDLNAPSDRTGEKDENDSMYRSFKTQQLKEYARWFLRAIVEYVLDTSTEETILRLLSPTALRPLLGLRLKIHILLMLFLT